MAYLPEQLEMMLAEEKSKVSELERQLAIVTDLEQKYTGYWHDSETLRVAAENRLQQVQFAYYNLVSIQAKVCERIHELEEALGYYAHPDVYEPRVTLGGTRQPGVLTEGGENARAILAKQAPFTVERDCTLKVARQAQKDVSGDTSDPAKYQKQAPGDNTAQVRCVGCSGILIQQNLCHDCAETTQDDTARNPDGTPYHGVSGGPSVETSNDTSGGKNG